MSTPRIKCPGGGAPGMRKASPMLAKAIGLLELSKEELSEKIEREISTSPCLQRDAQMTFAPVHPGADVIVKRKIGGWTVELNEGGIVKVRVVRRNPSNKPKGTKDYRKALRFVKSINYRRKILLKAAKTIILFQKEFLDKGPESLKILTPARAAEMCGCHESTISRVTRNKYVRVEGREEIFPLRFFMKKESDEIREKIRKIIRAENPRKPFSDSRIAKMLKKEGSAVVRRTVTKYRNMMDIGHYRKRKRGKML